MINSNNAEQQTHNNAGFNKKLQIRNGEDLPPKHLWSENADLKLIQREQRKRRRQRETAKQKAHRFAQ